MAVVTINYIWFSNWVFFSPQKVPHFVFYQPCLSTDDIISHPCLVKWRRLSKYLLSLLAELLSTHNLFLSLLSLSG